MAIGVTKQQNIAVNKARHLIFFEGTNVCYNYKTQQWSRIPAYDGLGVYSLNDKDSTFGLVRFSGNAVDLQGQSSSGEVQTATITTSAPDIQEQRAVLNGVRPRANGGTFAIRAGRQDTVSDSVSWSATATPNSRSNIANFRSEGRYHRVEFTITGGFDSAIGADIDVSPQGRV